MLDSPGGVDWIGERRDRLVTGIQGLGFIGGVGWANARLGRVVLVALRTILRTMMYSVSSVKI